METGLDVVPIYDFNSVSYLINNEKLAKVSLYEISGFSGASLPESLTKILAEVKDSQVNQKDL